MGRQLHRLRSRYFGGKRRPRGRRGFSPAISLRTSLSAPGVAILLSLGQPGAEHLELGM
jgi:hypothetical protein